MIKSLLPTAAILALSMGLAACSTHDTMMKEEMMSEKENDMGMKDTMMKDEKMMPKQENDMGMEDTMMKDEKMMSDDAMMEKKKM